MNLTISGHHLEVTPALREYVLTKLDRVTRHFDQVVDVNVLLRVEPNKEKERRQKAEVTLASGAFARPAYGYGYDYGYAPAASYGYGYRYAYPTSGFAYDVSPGYGYYPAARVYRRARPVYVTERRYYRNNPSLYNYGPRYASGYGCRVVTRRTPVDPWTYQVRRVRICG